MAAKKEHNLQTGLGILHQPKLNISQAAAALNMSRTTFNRLREKGDLPASISIAGREFWLEADLERWLIHQNPHLQRREILAQQAAVAVAKQREFIKKHGIRAV